MATDAQKRASAKYDRANTKSILLKLNNTMDADIIAKLDNVENRQGYIKSLVRADIKGDDDNLSIDAIKTFIIPVAKKLEISRAYLFGSYARGEANAESDIDIMIEGATLDSMTAYLEVLDRLRNSTGKNIDLVEREVIEQDKGRFGKRLLSHIEKEKVLIYEAI